MFLRDISWGNQNNLTLAKKNIGELTVRVLDCSAVNRSSIKGCVRLNNASACDVVLFGITLSNEK
jgi:hypothetical protein